MCSFLEKLENKCFCVFLEELCEKEIEVDGEPATITLVDMWDAEVR